MSGKWRGASDITSSRGGMTGKGYAFDNCMSNQQIAPPSLPAKPTPVRPKSNRQLLKFLIVCSHVRRITQGVDSTRTSGSTTPRRLWSRRSASRLRRTCVTSSSTTCRTNSRPKLRRQPRSSRSRPLRRRIEAASNAVYCARPPWPLKARALESSTQKGETK